MSERLDVARPGSNSPPARGDTEVLLEALDSLRLASFRESSSLLWFLRQGRTRSPISSDPIALTMAEAVRAVGRRVRSIERVVPLAGGKAVPEFASERDRS